MSVFLESRPVYSIGTAARLTGIKTDTLRVWERRYGLGPRAKSSSGRREYSQSDVEHLQIVSALIHQGNKIGDIARLDRKTLELMVANGAETGNNQSLSSKPRVLVIGGAVAEWLDQHPGVFANVSAFVTQCTVEEYLLEPPEPREEFAILIVESTQLSTSILKNLRTLKDAVNAKFVLVCHENGRSTWADTLEDFNARLVSLPPKTIEIGAALNTFIIDESRLQGDTNAGELVESKPKLFSEIQLSELKSQISIEDCACPQHLGELIGKLNAFEAYSSECAADDWQDAAIHSCIYAYTNQARWLMEKALQAALEKTH